MSSYTESRFMPPFPSSRGVDVRAQGMRVGSQCDIPSVLLTETSRKL